MDLVTQIHTSVSENLSQSLTEADT